jgi:hypothetical protein
LETLDFVFVFITGIFATGAAVIFTVLYRSILLPVKGMNPDEAVAYWRSKSDRPMSSAEDFAREIIKPKIRTVQILDLVLLFASTGVLITGAVLRSLEYAVTGRFFSTWSVAVVVFLGVLPLTVIFREQQKVCDLYLREEAERNGAGPGNGGSEKEA